MKVQEFMSYLAKEANISNMTVETKDGRRISATFENGIPTGVLSPSEPSEPPKENADGVSKDDKASEEPSGKKDKINKEDKNNGCPSPSREIATTIAMLTGAPASTLTAKSSQKLPSQEWDVNYQNKHVAVTYSSVAAGASSLSNGNGHKSNGSSTLPPKKRAAKQEDGGSESSWNAMTALVDAATVAQREHVQIPSLVNATTFAMVGNGEMEPKKKATKRKSRKIIPEVKVYVEFTQKDVLFGRGGRSNHHPGNKTYRDIVTNQQTHYRGCDKNEKTRVAQGIVDHIQNIVGGRFLELDRDAKRWFLVPNVVARRKVGQALRENNTEEARAAKRAKYQGRLSIGKKDGPDSEDASMAAMSDVSTANGSLQVSGANGISIPVNGMTAKIEDTDSSKHVAV